MFGLSLCGFKFFRVIKENAYLKKCSSLQERAQKLGFSDNSIVSIHFRIML